MHLTAISVTHRRLVPTLAKRVKELNGTITNQNFVINQSRNFDLILSSLGHYRDFKYVSHSVNKDKAVITLQQKINDHDVILKLVLADINLAVILKWINCESEPYYQALNQVPGIQSCQRYVVGRSHNNGAYLSGNELVVFNFHRKSYTELTCLHVPGLIDFWMDQVGLNLFLVYELDSHSIINKEVTFIDRYTLTGSHGTTQVQPVFSFIVDIGSSYRNRVFRELNNPVLPHFRFHGSNRHDFRVETHNNSARLESLEGELIMLLNKNLFAKK